MKRNETELSYRRSAIEGASPIGLVIALYDTLSGDLRRAASAIRNNDIEARCKDLNHAVLVLGQLEDWIDQKNGGELAQNLSSFYSYLRAKMMEASLSQSAQLLEAQIDLILQVRSAWQQRDMSSPQAPEMPAEVRTQLLGAASTPTPERTVFSRSA
jgi:flagellar secretion chaperone FliS